MVTVRVHEELYRELRQALEPEAAFEKGARSYLERPRVRKLSLEGSPEQRLDELMLMLAQTRAACGVLKTREATEGRDYAAGREEYTTLADELESLQAEASGLEEQVASLAREVAGLEAGLIARGGDPGPVEPPFPKSVTRPHPATPPAPERGGLLARLWRRVSGSGGRVDTGRS